MASKSDDLSVCDFFFWQQRKQIIQALVSFLKFYEPQVHYRRSNEGQTIVGFIYENNNRLGITGSGKLD